MFGLAVLGIVGLYLFLQLVVAPLFGYWIGRKLGWRGKKAALTTFVGFLLVFVPVAGSFMEPGLVGGAKGSMVGSMIDTQYSTSLNMGYGAALSCVLLIVLSIIMALIRLSAARAQRAIGGDVS